MKSLRKKTNDVGTVKESHPFGFLPPDVIVSCILPFHVVLIESEFGCFGYFKRDPSRHVWFIFKSVYWGRKKTMLSRRLLEHIEINSNFSPYDEELLAKFIKVQDISKFFSSPGKFHNLHSVSLGVKLSDCQRVKLSLFASSRNLPELKSLEMKAHVMFFHVTERSWEVELKGLEKTDLKLKSFSFDVRSDYFAGNIQKFEELRFVRLKRIDFSKLSMNTELRLSKLDLKDLQLRRCSNIDLFLRIVKVDNVQRLTYNGREYERLKRFCFSNLQHLHLSVGNALSSTNPKLESSMFDLKKLKKAHLCGFDLSSFFPSARMPSLTKLNVEDCELFDCKFLSYPKLKALRFASCVVADRYKASDSVFQEENRFPSLEKLFIRQNYLVSGRRWKLPFSTLKNINFCHLSNLQDEFFEKNSFSGLRVLTLKCCNNVTGKGWKPMPRLRELWFVRMSVIGTEFFEKYSFPELEMLVVHSFRKMEQEKWKEMPALKTTDVRKLDPRHYY